MLSQLTARLPPGVWISFEQKYFMCSESLRASELTMHLQRTSILHGSSMPSAIFPEKNSAPYLPVLRVFHYLTCGTCWRVDRLRYEFTYNLCFTSIEKICYWKTLHTATLFEIADIFQSLSLERPWYYSHYQHHWLLLGAAQCAFDRMACNKLRYKYALSVLNGENWLGPGLNGVWTSIWHLKYLEEHLSASRQIDKWANVEVPRKTTTSILLYEVRSPCFFSFAIMLGSKAHLWLSTALTFMTFMTDQRLLKGYPWGLSM